MGRYGRDRLTKWTARAALDPPRGVKTVDEVALARSLPAVRGGYALGRGLGETAQGQLVGRDPPEPS